MRNTICLIVLIGSVLLACEHKDRSIIENSSLPRMDLIINENYLWNPDSGLYIIGDNGVLGCSEVANFNQKWEYPARLSFSINGEIAFDDSIGFRIKGNCTRKFSMKSFGIYWRKEYGAKNVKYPIFEDEERTKFKRLFLRNSGNDFGKTHIKDAAIMQIIKDFAHVDCQNYRPSNLYLNGEYWGIYNVREMITPHYFDYKYGVDDDHVDILMGVEERAAVDDGSAEDFNTNVIGYIQTKDLSNDNYYEHIKTLIDLESYIDYVIIETYIANSDWPGGNAKWWRDASSTGYKKWRWVLYDTDWAFQLKNTENIWIGDLYGNSFSEYEGLIIFNALIKNDLFRQAFLDRYMFFVDVVFEKERVAKIINALKEAIAGDYAYHQRKWETLPQSAWEKEIEKLIIFNNKRNDIMREVVLMLKNK